MERSYTLASWTSLQTLNTAIEHHEAGRVFLALCEVRWWPNLEIMKKAKWTLLWNPWTMPCPQLVPKGASSDPCLGELCPYINFISGNCTKYAASEQFSILLSKYFHRKQTLELTRYNYRYICFLHLTGPWPQCPWSSSP